jgi:hypothetical protein
MDVSVENRLHCPKKRAFNSQELKTSLSRGARRRAPAPSSVRPVFVSTRIPQKATVILSRSVIFFPESVVTLPLTSRPSAYPA